MAEAEWCLLRWFENAAHLIPLLKCLYESSAMVSGTQHGALARATMAKPCPWKCGVLNVRVSIANGLTELLGQFTAIPSNSVIECIF